MKIRRSFLLQLIICFAFASPISANGPLKKPTQEMAIEPQNHQFAKSKCKKKNKKCKNFFFDAIGDLNYLTTDESEMQSLIVNVINKEKPAFVVHLGDLQTSPGSYKYPDALPIAINEEQWRQKRDFWWQIKVPFLTTPGDNDWADTMCPCGERA